jgi:transcriptional regulator with XRE-family HTH domain
MLVGAGIGAKLRSIRQQWQLSLREVERRSVRVAEERGNRTYQVSASWLDRLEREEHELSVNKLVSLAEIYNIPAEWLLASAFLERSDAKLLEQLTDWAGSMITGETSAGAREVQADCLERKSEVHGAARPGGSSPYRLGIIGKRDATLDPMIPSGSVVLIDTRLREVAVGREWPREFLRPIYFLASREGYWCGWCELNSATEQLALIPHPLSPAPTRRWKYPSEVENIGRVVMVAVQMDD